MSVPLALIIAGTVNSIMPMINHLATGQDSDHQSQIKSWFRLWRRGSREEAESLAEVNLRLHCLRDTVNPHLETLTTERELMAITPSLFLKTGRQIWVLFTSLHNP
jgi:hypothetical protein